MQYSAYERPHLAVHMKTLAKKNNIFIQLLWMDKKLAHKQEGWSLICIILSFSEGNVDMVHEQKDKSE